MMIDQHISCTYKECKGKRDFMAKRKPTTPGEILQEEYLTPLGITQQKLADHIDYDVKVINRLINGRTTVTAPLALKLAAALNTSPEFWLNAQKAVDIYEASKTIGRLPKTLILNNLAIA